MNQTTFVSLCFFLSGVSALIYEVVWARMLTTVFGATLYAVSTVTSVFLGGLAMGAFLAGKFLKQEAKQRLFLYAGIEVAVGVLGIALPFVFGSPWLPQAWAQLDTMVATEPLSYFLRFLIVCVLLLPPTILMGATLPVLVGALVPPGTGQDDATQTLYAANTSGGAIGALLGGFFLLPALGLSTTSMVAGALNLLAAFGAVASVKAKPAPPRAEPVKKTANPVPALAKINTIYSVAFLSGLILLAMEVCWTRWFALILGSSVYSLSCVLAIFLVSLAAGAWLVNRVLKPLGNGLLLMSTAYFLSCTYILVTLYAANELPWQFLSLCQMLSGITGGFTFGSTLAARAILVSLLIGPPTLLLGTVLPLLLGANNDNKPQFVGRLYAINVGGAICGALISGFSLIPGLSALAETGIRWTIVLALIGQIAVSVWLFVEWSRSFVTDPDTRAIVNGIVAFVTVAVVVDVAFFRPEWNRTIASAGASFFTGADLKRVDHDAFLLSIGAPDGEDSAKFYREGLNATVTVGQDDRRNVTFLKTDGKVEAAVPTDPIDTAPGADSTTHMLLGALPPSLVAGDKLNALVIGYGSGTTSGAVLVNPRVQELTIAELESAVYAADRFFSQSNGNPLSQKLRVRKKTNDGRYVLSSGLSQYDVIVCQPSDPWVSGAAELFTENFWTLAKSRLKPNGAISQWVQLYSIRPQDFTLLCRTFAQVFPNCCLILPPRAGECVLIGLNCDKPLTTEQIAQALHTENVNDKQIPAGYRSLSSIISSATVLDGAAVKALVSSSPGDSVNTDDRNAIEFAAARGAMTQRQNIDENAQLVRGFAPKPSLSR